MKYLEKVCKIGQGAECCRYIVAGAGGITCAKLTPLKSIIDGRVSKMVAKGDNCEGKSEDIPLTGMTVTDGKS